jgi:hypothetical protein
MDGTLYQHVTKSMRHEARANVMRPAWRWYDDAIEQLLGQEEIQLRFKIVSEYDDYMHEDCTCNGFDDINCRACKHYQEYSYLCLENYGKIRPWED